MKNKIIELENFQHLKMITAEYENKEEIYDIYDKKIGFQGTVKIQNEPRRFILELTNQYGEELLKNPCEINFLLQSLNREQFEVEVWVGENLMIEDKRLIINAETINQFAKIRFENRIFKTIENGYGIIMEEREKNRYETKYKNLAYISYIKRTTSSIKAFEEPYTISENERREYKIFFSNEEVANIMLFYAVDQEEREAVLKYMEIKKWKENGKDYRTEK